MDELVAWLRAQLDEDERIARAADAGPWEFKTLGRHDQAAIRTAGGLIQFDGSRASANGVHALAHDPARVLREIDAKRSIVDDLTEELHWAERKGPDYQDGADACERTLKRLALPYADRPGYQPSWRL